MRAAAKVGGIGVMTGLRGGAAADFPASLAVRPASEQAGGGLKAVQWPAWEIDDWELAGDGLIADRIDAGDPRVVFGPAPTILEAKEATSQLKDVIDKVYPPSSGSAGLFSSLQGTKACVTREWSVPRGAMEAFMLLKERPAVQTVVASIACDPNVWNAMMQNPALVEFLKSEKKFTGAQFEVQESPKSRVGSSDAEVLEKPSDLFKGFIEDVKLTVQDMVNTLSNFAQSFFSEPNEDEKAENSDGTFRTFFAGGTLMALVMMVITMVVLKRPY